MSDAASLLAQYAALGFRFVFYASGSKHPSGTEGSEWTTREYKVQNYRDGDNIGVVLGHEIAPGRYLCDIDFDWADGIHLAKHFLPDTNFGFGRSTKPLSHVFYTTSQPVPLEKYEDVDGVTLVELRGTKTDGTLGLQTMMPPSKHPSGELIEVRAIGVPTHDDTIPRRVTLYAIMCCLYRHLGKGGFTHDVRMAVAGFLLTEGVTEPECVTIGNALIQACENKDVQDVALTVKTTSHRIHKLQPVVGRGVLSNALNAGGKDGKKILARIRRWLGSADFTADDKDRVIKDSQQNIQIALDKLKVKLHFDQFAQKAHIKYNGYTGYLNEPTRRALWLDIDKKFQFRPTPDFFTNVILNIADHNPLHPVKIYLDALKWDGVPRIDTWLQTYGGSEDSDYLRAVGAIVLMAAVRRVRKPGCKFDELLVLESEQGTMKSSALRALCPDDQWFSDDLPLAADSKQVIERTAGKWIIEAAELHGNRRSEAEQLKSFLSRQTDGPVRLAYDRVPTEVPRQFIIIGTTNAMTGYLKDDTGSRRFWPTRVKGFRIDALVADRDQLWAEACHREAKGESIRLDVKHYAEAARAQEHRRLADDWEHIIDGALGEGTTRVPVSMLWDALGMSADRLDARHSARIAAIMQRLGFVRKVKRRVEKGMAAVWCWEKPGVDTLLDQNEGVE